MADLSTVDPVARVLQHLRAHAGVLLAFGGTPDHISGLTEAPWPHLRVTDGQGGDLRQLRYSAVFEVTLEVYGAPLLATSEGEVRRLLMKAMLAIKELEDLPHVPGTAPVSFVEPSGVLINQKVDNSQYRLTAGVLLTMRPATD